MKSFHKSIKAQIWIRKIIKGQKLAINRKIKKMVPKHFQMHAQVQKWMKLQIKTEAQLTIQNVSSVQCYWRH